MNFSKEQEIILSANGWEQSTAGEAHKFIRGCEWVSISGNIVNWSGRCKTYSPSMENFKNWAMQIPVYFNPAVKAKIIADILLQKTFENTESRRTS